MVVFKQTSKTRHARLFASVEWVGPDKLIGNLNGASLTFNPFNCVGVSWFVLGSFESDKRSRSCWVVVGGGDCTIEEWQKLMNTFVCSFVSVFTTNPGVGVIECV